ncbi:MAG TPA: 1,2-phenylacetyl-CoA epoxidase subunit PaaD [Mycobacteriales bacterium]
MSAWAVAAAVPDPELPMVTVADLGILRSVEAEGEAVTVTITPTYSGCPALREISLGLEGRLRDAGYIDVRIVQSLAPAWSSDWITPEGRAKLATAGIAPPSTAERRDGPIPLSLRGIRISACPRCGSDDTRETSRFSGSACKALHRCGACGEPYESIKAI